MAVFDAYDTWDALPADFKTNIKPFLGTDTIPAEANAMVTSMINKLIEQIVTGYTATFDQFERFYESGKKMGGFLEDDYIPRVDGRTPTGRGDTAADITAAYFAPAFNDPVVSYFEYSDTLAYKVSTEEDITKEAFRDEASMSAYITKQVSVIFESLKADRRATVKHLLAGLPAEVLAENANWEGEIDIAGEYNPLGIDSTAAGLMTSTILAIKQLAASFEEDSEDYNANEVVHNAAGKELVLFIKSGVKNSIETLVSANTFNPEYLRANVTVIPVDDLGDSVVTTEGGATITTTVAGMVIEAEAVRVREAFQRYGAFYNAENGITNTFLTVKDMYRFNRNSNVGVVNIVKTVPPSI